jgi:hypothetical protein
MGKFGTHVAKSESRPVFLPVRNTYSYWLAIYMETPKLLNYLKKRIANLGVVLHAWNPAPGW